MFGVPLSLDARLDAEVFAFTLVVATLAFYNPIVRNQFIDFDDQSYILKNSHIQHGLTWDTVKWSFTTFYYGNWHPLTWLSHALDYQLFHLNPAGHHYTSLLLHAANVVLLFLLLQRRKRPRWAPQICPFRLMAFERARGSQKKRKIMLRKGIIFGTRFGSSQGLNF